MHLSSSRPPRFPALDLARTLGVVAMVFGHTCDALLSPAARTAPTIATYWKARGLTAPLFMMVSGWAVTLAFSCAPARGLEMIRARLPRVALLLALGYLLRFPAWNVHALFAGDRRMWQHLLAFDALHVIAAGLLGTMPILVFRSSRLRQGLAFAVFAAIAVGVGMLSPGWQPATLPALALAQAVGGTSPFPLCPWVAYFFLGAATPLLASDVRVRVAVGIASVGVFLAASACWQGFGSMSPAHPILVLFRVGVVLLLLAVLESVPARVATVLAPLARSSLYVYVIHVPVLYGWFTLEGLAQKIGPRLPLSEVALIAVAILVSVLAVERVIWLVGRGWRGQRSCPVARRSAPRLPDPTLLDSWPLANQ